MSFPDLYLLRHGQTEWNVQGRLQGRLDSPLTPLGVVQARRQARLLADLPSDLDAFCSPAGRAQATASIALGDRACVTDARLREIDVGSFTGLALHELQTSHPQVFAHGGIDWYDHVPGGEGFARLRQRVVDFLTRLERPAIVVTHGVTLRMIRLVAMGLPDGQVGQMPVLQGAVHQVRAGAHRVLY